MSPLPQTTAKKDLQSQLDAEVAEKELAPKTAAPGVDLKAPATVAPASVVPSAPTPTIQPMPVNVKQLMTGDAQRTKEYLDSLPQEPFYIPVGIGEKAGKAEIDITINGFRTTYKKGVRYMMPSDHVRMLMDHLQMNGVDPLAEALRIDRNDQTLAALT